MKTALTVACALLFVSLAASAQAPSQAPLSSEALAAILGTPLPDGSCAPQASEVVFAAKRPRVGVKALCSATANCESGTVSCQGNNSTTSCSAFDRNCANGEQGHVTCDGMTTWCPTVCPNPCETGTPLQMACCRCNETAECFDCCRCGGGSFNACVRACGSS